MLIKLLNIHLAVNKPIYYFRQYPESTSLNYYGYTHSEAKFSLSSITSYRYRVICLLLVC